MIYIQKKIQYCQENLLIDWIGFYVPLELFYGYVEMDDDNVERYTETLSSISRKMVLLNPISHRHGMRWTRRWYLSMRLYKYGAFHEIQEKERKIIPITGN